MTQDLYTYPQLIGYVALVIYIVGYAVRSDNRLKIIFSVSNLFWIAHYYLIGAHTAAFLTAIITIRNLLSLDSHQFSQKRKGVTFAVFTILIAGVTIISWDGMASALAAAGCIGFTYAGLYLRGIRMRGVLLLTDIIWLVHAMIVVSYSGLIYAAAALMMNAFTMYRMSRAEHGSPPARG